MIRLDTARPVLFSRLVQGEHQIAGLSGNYRNDRYKLIRAVEGVEMSPYVDSAKIPTIGIGFNIQIKSHANRLFNILWGSVSSYPEDRRDAERAFGDDVAKTLHHSYASDDALQTALEGFWTAARSI